LTDDVTTVIRDLHRNLSSSLLPRVVLSSDQQIKDEDVIQLIGLMSGWYSLLCLGGWLGFLTNSGVMFHEAHPADISEYVLADSSIPIPFIGEKMVSRLMSTRESDTGLRNETLDNLQILVFAIILRELGHRPEAERPSHIDLIVAVYISFYGAIGASSK
jgi:hypothetical protein